jgi:hypothetical protein
MPQAPPRRMPTPLNLAPFALDSEDQHAEPPPPCRDGPRRRPAGAFLAGPLSWMQLDRAASLLGRALHLWLILNHKVRLSRSKTRTVSVSLKRIGAGHDLNESAARRALRALEGTGLLSVVRRLGRALEVTLEEPPTGVGGET